MLLKYPLTEYLHFLISHTMRFQGKQRDTGWSTAFMNSSSDFNLRWGISFHFLHTGHFYTLYIQLINSVTWSISVSVFKSSCSWPQRGHLDSTTVLETITPTPRSLQWVSFEEQAKAVLLPEGKQPMSWGSELCSHWAGHNHTRPK